MAEKKKTSLKRTAPKKTPAPRPKSQKKQTNRAFGDYLSAVRQNISTNRNLYLRYLIIILLVLAVGAFLYWRKNWFVAAVVNNQPITTIEYYQNLKEKDNKQVLNQIIQDKLINQEANRKGINISEADINKKISEIEKQVGGKEQLQQALESRNISQAEFKNQIRTQLMVEKLLFDKIEVSDEEIEDFITKNKDNNLTGVDLADKEAIRSQLRNDKLNEQFQAWYQKLQKDSKTYIFI